MPQIVAEREQTEKAAAEASARKAIKEYRNRRLMYSTVNIVLIFAIIIFITLCMLILKRPDYSEIENRDLAEFPKLTVESYFSGEYMRGISEYFRDTIPMREQLVTLEGYLGKMKGIRFDDVTFHGNISVVTEGTELTTADTIPQQTLPIISGAETGMSESVVTAETQPTASETEDTGETLPLNEFSHNGIAVVDTRGIMLFGGNNSQGTHYANVINQYKAEMGEGVNVYNMVVPTSVEFYLPKKYRKYSGSEKNCIEHIYSELSPDVTSIDAYSRLAEHKDEYIYFRTDHHWAPLGAYYAYTAFCDELGLEYPSLDEYEHKTKEGYVGSLFGYSGDVVLRDNPDTFDYYKPQVDYTTTFYNYDTLRSQGSGNLFQEYVEGGACYSMFIGADALHIKITTENKNGRKIAVFKESYGNAFVPFLVSNFEEIYVIDIRYFGTNAVSYMKQQGITDILFINNIFAANTASLINSIDRLRYSPTGSIVTTVAPPETISETSADIPMPAPEIPSAETIAPPPAETLPVTPGEQTNIVL